MASRSEGALVELQENHSRYGDCSPRRNLPVMAELHQRGRIDLDAFVVCTHGHNDHINAAAPLADKVGARC